MLSNILKKIKTYPALFFFQIFYLIIASLILFLLLGIRNASVNKFVFIKDSVLIFEII